MLLLNPFLPLLPNVLANLRCQKFATILAGVAVCVGKIWTVNNRLSYTHSKPVGVPSGSAHTAMTYTRAPVVFSHSFTFATISPGSSSSTLSAGLVTNN
jgi:hypothetical protein